MPTRLAVLTLTTLLALAGCNSASVSESQCIASDWQTIGYRDGVGGLQSTRLLDHQDACVKHGIIPSRTEYMIGWEEGVQSYCQPSNGFTVGNRGRAYQNVCPDHLTPAFLSAYQDGRELFSVRRDVANLERSIAQKHARLEQLKSAIIASAAEQLNTELTTEERVKLIAETQRLNEEKTRIKVELPDLEHRLEHQRGELNHLSRSLAGAY